MIIYFLFPTISLILYLSKHLRKYFFEAFFLFTILFLCFGYMTGSDWRTYEPFYENIRQNNIVDKIQFRHEPGYVLINYIFASLNVPFWAFFTVIKTILLTTIYSVAIKHLPSKKHLLLFFLIVYSLYLLYQYIDNPMRNLIAATIFTKSVSDYLIKQKKRYLILTLLCPLFHTSSLIAVLSIPFILFKHKKHFLIFIYIVIMAIFSYNRLLIYLACKLLDSNYMAVKRIQFYIESEIYGSGKVVSIGFLLVNVIYAYLHFKYKEKIVKDKIALIIWNLGFLFLIIYRISLTLLILSRLQIYFYIFFYINIVKVYTEIKSKYKVMLLILFTSVTFYTSYTLVYNNSKYLPYTNILMHYEPGLDYYSRSSFNERMLGRWKY